MPKGTCASCLDFDVNKIVKSKESLKPEWLQRNDYQLRSQIDQCSFSSLQFTLTSTQTSK